MNIKLHRLALILLLAVTSVFAQGLASQEHDKNCIAFIADLHLGDRGASWNYEYLNKCVDGILNHYPIPGTVIVLGDFGIKRGEPAGYSDAKPILDRLENNGVHVEVLLGECDRRQNFIKAFPEKAAQKLNLKNRLVSVCETPRANFILLDSLLEGKMTGDLDKPQQAWLEATLKKADKPTFVCAHHPLNELTRDSNAIAALIMGSPHGCGFICGHNKTWGRSEIKGCPTLSVPSTGNSGDIGYVIATLEPDSAVFTFYPLDHFKMKPLPTPKPDWVKRLAWLKKNTVRKIQFR